MKNILLSKLSLSLLLIPSLSEAATAWTLTSGTVGVDTTLEFTATDTDLALSGTMTITMSNVNFVNSIDTNLDSRIRIVGKDAEDVVMSFSYSGDSLQDTSMLFGSWGGSTETTFATPVVQVTQLPTVAPPPTVFNGDGDGTKADGDPVELGPLLSAWGSVDLGNVSGVNGSFNVDGIHGFTKVGNGSSASQVAGVEIFGTLAVPEPSSTALLFGLGCLGFVASRRRK